MSNIIEPLSCISQNYNWGKLGHNSVVAQLLDNGNNIDETKPYAELWMGSHPSGPSKIKSHSMINLIDYIHQVNKEQGISLMGDIVDKQFCNDFPFLFKVLSIRTALSIQSHPDCTLAKTLFKQFPDIYKDPYHKPEIAIAITPFEALCGFRPYNQIIDFIKTIPELSDSLPKYILNDNENNCKQLLKSIVTNLLNANAELISSNLFRLEKRLSEKEEKNELDILVIKLYKQYPGDVGVFFAYLLNYLTLQTGQALFLAAGEPHAYISGDLIECMAPSDNVVRAGLTPKFKDVATLSEMLTYTTGCPGMIQPTISSTSTAHLSFQPPVDEFQVDLYDFSKLPSSSEVVQRISVPSNPGPSIFLVLEGSNITIENDKQPSNNLTNISKGTVLFVPCNTPLHLINNTSNNNNPVLIYQASVNQRVFNNM